MVSWVLLVPVSDLFFYDDFSQTFASMLQRESVGYLDTGVGLPVVLSWKNGSREVSLTIP